MADALDNPGVDPHGDPIPDADLELPDAGETSRLSAAVEGDEVVVRRIRHQGDEELRYLADAGVEPGVELEVLEVAPFGLVTVRTPEGEQSLPEEIARLIETTATNEAEA
jgi:DtxR family Mn-dependent transcriptional regulator